MKTSDGYVIKTADGFLVAGKDPNNYDYPIVSNISTTNTYTSAIDP